MNSNSKDSAKSPRFKIASVWDMLHLSIVIHREQFVYRNFSQNVASFICSLRASATLGQKEDGILLLSYLTSFHRLN